MALDVHSSDTSKVLTGGNDKNATVFNKDTEQVVAILKGHTKKVTKVIYHPDEDLVLTGKFLHARSVPQISDLPSYLHARTFKLGMSINSNPSCSS